MSSELFMSPFSVLSKFCGLSKDSKPLTDFSWWLRSIARSALIVLALTIPITEMCQTIRVVQLQFIVRASFCWKFICIAPLEGHTETQTHTLNTQEVLLVCP